MLVSPNAPYVSIGRHQDAAREVALPYCAEAGYPVIRREIGGGAVYLDGNQLFTQWIFHADHLPATVEQRFAVYADSLVRTYRALGIAAEHPRPVPARRSGAATPSAASCAPTSWPWPRSSTPASPAASGSRRPAGC